MSRRACVIVLGDLGRSPRMQYHCLSLAKHNFNVDFVGYSGCQPSQSILLNQKIKFHYVKESPTLPEYIPRKLIYIFKAVWQTITLLYSLLLLSKPNVVLVQNPPAVPTLLVAFLYSKLIGAKFVIDWHNYGFTILSMSLSKDHPLVRFYRNLEIYFGRKADAHFCVTNAMKRHMASHYEISNAVVLYDRPPDNFRSVSLTEKHQLFKKLAREYKCFAYGNQEGETLFTTEITEGGGPALREDRPALLLSSTSWTEDEDFSILLDALQKYDHLCLNSNNLPKIVCIITGKGPLKSYYNDQIVQKNLKSVTFCTPWLTAEDYPTLLACADVGVSLHSSSSGLDLPMKVVDMFGCGTPVLALNFNCLHELVKNGENGLLYAESDDLCQHLQDVFDGFPAGPNDLLEKLKQGVKSFQNLRWDQNWNQHALKVMQQN